MSARKVRFVFISSKDRLLKPGPPPPLKIESADRLDNWTKWEFSFKNYAKAIDLHEKSQEEQISTFKSLIGPDAMEIYNSFNTEDMADLESIIKKFHDYFNNVIDVDLEEVVIIKQEAEEEEEKEFDRLVCEHCGYRALTVFSLHGHIMKKHTEKNYVCADCNRRFVSVGALKAHMVVHLPDDEKPLACNKCDKRFVGAPAWKAHLASHLRKKSQGSKKREKFTCEVCHREFTMKCNLQTHMRRHTGEKPYACHLCEFKSVCLSGLSSHLITTHSEEKPHKCDVCGYRTKLKGCLTQHMLTHTNEMPHSCNVCGKRFRQSSHAKRHMMVHTGEKPYACEVCGHRWTTNGNLKAHMKIHLGGPSTPRKRKKKTVSYPKEQSYDGFSDDDSDEDAIFQILGAAEYERR